MAYGASTDQPTPPSPNTVCRFEADGNVDTVRRLQAALEAAGVIFLISVST